MKLAEVRASAADDKLTIAEILALPSLRKGRASVYEKVAHSGAFRPQGFGNGSLQLVANGLLEDGRSFQVEWTEMRKKDGGGVSYVRHARLGIRNTFRLTTDEHSWFNWQRYLVEFLKGLSGK
jgi:hypothetical protein